MCDLVPIYLTATGVLGTWFVMSSLELAIVKIVKKSEKTFYLFYLSQKIQI